MATETAILKGIKTKIRSVETKFHNGYKHMLLEVLGKRNKRYDTLESIGTISFQMTENDPQGYRWYAMHFKVESDRPEYFTMMAKLAKYILANCSSSAQPEEVKQIIGAEEYIHHHSDFIPVSFIGMNFYKVITKATPESPEIYQTKIIAPNEIIAEKMLRKMNIANSRLLFSHVITG